MSIIRTGLALWCVAAVVIGGHETAVAANAPAAYPTKPIRMIAPFPAGGGVDFIARQLGEKLAESLGQAIVVDNRAGAGSTIGTAIAASATPDGYTILLTSNALSVSSELYKNLPYNPVKDLAPISLVAASPNVLVVNSSTPASSVQGLIQLAKDKQSNLNYASGGIGGSAHVCAEYFLGAAKIKVAHVAYKGTPPALTDLVAGNVQFMMAPISPAFPLMKAGRIRALGVTSAKRTPLLPDVPTIAESGLPGFEYATWYGLLAPVGTPRQIVDRLNGEVRKALELPDVQKRLSAQGLEPSWQSVEQFKAYVRSEIAKWGPIVRASRTSK